jgi:hypothetical protein
MSLQFKVLFEEEKGLDLGGSIQILATFLVEALKVDARLSAPIFFKENYKDCHFELLRGVKDVSDNLLARVLEENKADVALYPGLVEQGANFRSELGFIVGWTYVSNGLELSFTGKIGGVSGNGFNVLADNGTSRLDFDLATKLYSCAISHPSIYQAQILPRHIKLLRLYRNHQLALGLNNYFAGLMASSYTNELPKFRVRQEEYGLSLLCGYRPEPSDTEVPMAVIEDLVTATALMPSQA